MKNTIDQRTNLNIELDDFLPTWIDAFFINKQAEGLSPNTIKFYTIKLSNFLKWCDTKAITHIKQITPPDLRAWLVDMEQAGHNAGGRHCHYRAVKTFLRWYQEEAEPEDWQNPIQKVKAPKLPTAPLEPVTLADFDRLMTAAAGSTQPKRDQAILLALLDTGARAAEFVAMSLPDVNLLTGAILIPKGKGSKPRTVFIGKKTRKALRAYLKTRCDQDTALWVTDDGTRLTQSGLRQVLRRLAERAGIPEPGAHDFRRAFALNMLRGGCDVFTLARLMGHASIQVLQRYLAQTTEDTEAAHKAFGFVDKM